MGAGGDGIAAVRAPRARQVLKRVGSHAKRLGDVKDDLVVLKSIWFNRVSGDDHAARLESFYSPQAAAYDKFRARFLWGRKPMLAACAARLPQRNDLVWVDLGGGTGENVDLMARYAGLSRFRAIYVVDLCGALAAQARAKAAAKGWHNVHVVHADACGWRPPITADLVTFSYSLSMIPAFHAAVDAALGYLDPVAGLVGVADFFTSAKHDLPLRQQGWGRRFLWRAIFDCDGIDVGPERRALLDHRLSREWELNSQGSIPWVPLLRAPWFAWVGRARPLAAVVAEPRVEAPPCFPPTFLYTQSWEDPEPDLQVLDVNARDTVLTLTSGGCNALGLVAAGAGRVVAVDCNPAQSALLELKAAAIRHLDFEDVWALFGEGRHAGIDALFEARLAPWLSQSAHAFWAPRLWYFRAGLYFQGGMGRLVYCFHVLMTLLGMQPAMRRLANAPSLQAQRREWDALPLVRLCARGPAWLTAIVSRVLAFAFLNRLVLWWGGGVPCKQARLIARDGTGIAAYVARALDGVARASHVRGDNHFYYSCLTGGFARDCCPAYLQPRHFAALKAGGLDRLEVVTSTFMEQLAARTYTKVILMDHVDWLDADAARAVAAALGRAVAPGGRVILRSAALSPPYVPFIQQAGFQVKCLARVDEGYMDRVNMYASFFIAVRD